MNALLIFSIFFWFLHIQQRIFYSLYLWQLKEYRLDRFSEEVGRNKIIIFPKISLIALILVLTEGILGQYFLIFVFLLYLFFGLRPLILLARKRWRSPKFTKKMIVFLGLVWLFLAGLFVIFFSDALRFILIFEIFFPLFVFLSLQFIQIPTFFAKRYIFLKAKKKRERFKNLIVIGITGSFGKSSTKELLFEFLSGKFNVLKTEGNVNTEIGVAGTVLKKLKKEHQIFICEMAAYKRGEIKAICNIVKPKIGILTGINQQHLSLFGSQENIIRAKFELIESLPNDGIAFFNAKNNYCLGLFQKTKIKKILYGQEANFPGEENILGAIAIAKELGISQEEIARGRQRIEPWLQVKKGINGLNIIDATYSANPDGVIAHLEHLKTLRQAQGRLVIVMPCLIELGKAASEVHQRIGRKINEVCDLAIITTGDRLKEIKAVARDKVVFMADPNEIFKKLKEFNQVGDIILLEGGKESFTQRQLIKLLNV